MITKFRKVKISEERYESANFFDVDGDGVLDIVSGGFWYKGPHFTQRFKIGDISEHGEYYDDFSTIPLDINGNGRLDFITGGWWGGSLRWRENPEDPTKEWKEHLIGEMKNVETTRAWDVDGDGQLEIVPNVPSGPLEIFKLKTDKNNKGTGEFDRIQIYEGPQGHGLGFGDVTGNGRGDFILKHGWLEAPEDPYNGKWIYHDDFDLGYASIPVIVADVNGNGLNDLIVGQAHDYGLDWWEQSIDAQGNRSWTKRLIDPENSQYHDLIWIDIDGDGEKELLTGKRYRAHCGNDPGADDPLGIYYFKWNGESFSKQVIDYGPVGLASGAGIFMGTADLTGNGLPDILAPGKDGLYLFFNLG